MEDIIERYRNEYILDHLKLGAPLPKVSGRGWCSLLTSLETRGRERFVLHGSCVYWVIAWVWSVWGVRGVIIGFFSHRDLQCYL